MNNLNLEKGDSLNLSKSNPSLTKARIASGWKSNDGNGGEFDLDVSCFMLKSNGKLVDGQKSVVFYGQKEIAVPAIIHSGDDQIGSTGSIEKDCESIDVDFSKLDPKCERLDFVITIFVDPKTKAGSDLTFGSVKNAFVRIVDLGTNREICRYNLSNDFNYAKAVLTCSLVKKGVEWHFEAVGVGEASADLNTYFDRYK